MNATDNPYTILGVSQDAEEDKIKKAYRKLAMKHHPDKQTNEEDRKIATEKFAKIADAYALLTDPVRRYDWRQANEKICSSSSTRGSSPVPKRTSAPSQQQSPPSCKERRTPTRSGSSNVRAARTSVNKPTAASSLIPKRQYRATSTSPKRSSTNAGSCRVPQPPRSASLGPNMTKRPTRTSSFATSLRRSVNSPKPNLIRRTLSLGSHKKPTTRVSGTQTKRPSNPMNSPRRSVSPIRRTSSFGSQEATRPMRKQKRPSNSPPRRSLNSPKPNPIQRTSSLGSHDATRPMRRQKRPGPSNPSPRSSVNSPIPNPIRRTVSLGSHTPKKPAVRVSASGGSLKSGKARRVPCEKGRKKTRIQLNGGRALARAA